MQEETGFPRATSRALFLRLAGALAVSNIMGVNQAFAGYGQV
jgi:hypothetical protein